MRSLAGTLLTKLIDEELADRMWAGRDSGTKDDQRS
jgi:hypothetical protein